MVLGWDIGGVNTKAALVDGGRLVRVREAPFELQRAPGGLVPLLRRLASALGCPPDTPHVVTMTAELSQMFRTKREGVGFVLEAIEAAFPSDPIHVFTVEGTFLDVAAARRAPLLVAASNWRATAGFVARTLRDALLIDVGTTTTDIVPIRDGQVIASGRTDPERLASGALVYCGAVRTPAEALLSEVTVRGVPTAVSAEGFALVGDAHVWLGRLPSEGYTAPTPDGRPATRLYAGERLARLVCADREMLDEGAVTGIATAIAEAQVTRLATAIRRMRAALTADAPAVVTGRGAFIAAAAAHRAGLRSDVLPLGDDAAAQCVPAAAAAWLFEQHAGFAVGKGVQAPRLTDVPPGAGDPPLVQTVLKVGGAALQSRALLEALVAALAPLAGASLLVVPGGGPFADAVRDVDARLRLSDSAAHWMAILAMDQYAELLVSRLACGSLVRGPREIPAALEAGRVAVLAPSGWLRDEDPLPHTWEVTSDSIAAWLAGRVGAGRLVLLKPPAAAGEMVDRYFARVRPPGVRVEMLTLDRVSELSAMLCG